MSFAAAHESRRFRQICQSCRDRKALFQYRGIVRADRDHTLCFECYRSELNRQRARRLVVVTSPAPLRAPFGQLKLSLRDVAHRRRMLQHLQKAAK
jgi:hypothetical protein